MKNFFIVGFLVFVASGSVLWATGIGFVAWMLSG